VWPQSRLGGEQSRDRGWRVARSMRAGGRAGGRAARLQSMRRAGREVMVDTGERVVNEGNGGDDEAGRLRPAKESGERMRIRPCGELSERREGGVSV
jgi:hypothetical protein